MTGRLLVDDEAAIERLEYSSARAEPAWDRFGLGFEGGGRLVVRDPRRLGGVYLEPDDALLGVDASALDRAALDVVLGASAAPLKARLLAQARLAGLGNLLVDEALWRARLAPARPAGGLDAAERVRLLTAIRHTLDELGQRGGSHTGDLHGSRQRGASCPRCGAPLRRETVGGRTTYWCPVEQG
jgi:formamidopyrimidine-DNA glycosylase